MIYEIFKDGKTVNTIVADEEFVKHYCSKNGFTYEEEIRPEPERKPNPEERLAELEATNAELEDAMCEMDSANQAEITELRENVSALEDAVCEMDALNEKRIAAVEDALCEMDMG